MAAKLLQLRRVGDTTWNTVPGNDASLERSHNEMDDTLFGQDFSSSETGLTEWSMSTNALYRGFAGYVAKIKKTGTATSFTAESLSQVGTSQTYRIDDATKDVWDWTVDVTVYDGGTEVDASDIDYIDYVFGQVVFVDSYTPSGSITADGSFLALEEFGKAQSFEITQSADTTDTTDLETAQSNGGFMTARPTLLTAEVSMTAFYNTSNDFNSLFSNRDTFLLEFNPDGSDESRSRGIFKVNEDSLSGDVGGDEEESVSFVLAVPNDVARPYGWEHDSATTLSEAVQIALDAWADKDEIEARYLPDGSVGDEGNVIVTDISLSGGVDSMNTFDLTLQGTGALSEVT